MKIRHPQLVLTGASPSGAGTAIVAATVKSEFLYRADYLTIDAALVGGTGGTLDVYVQRRVGVNQWVDWLHFPQVAAGASVNHTLIIDGTGSYNNPIVRVGSGTDASATPALAAGSITNCMPGMFQGRPPEIRLVYVAGGGTSAGATSTVTITPVSQRM